MKKLLAYRWKANGTNVEAYNERGDNFLIHEGRGKKGNSSVWQATPCSEYFTVTPAEAEAVAFAISKLPELLDAIEEGSSSITGIVEEIRQKFAGSVRQ